MTSKELFYLPFDNVVHIQFRYETAIKRKLGYGKVMLPNTLKQLARTILVKELSRPTRKHKLAQRKALTNQKESEKMDEEIMEVPMEVLESRLDDMPRPKPYGETKQEMLAEDPTRTIAVGTHMDLEVRVNLVTLRRENLTSLCSRWMRCQE